jgi:hypothetical protein
MTSPTNAGAGARITGNRCRSTWPAENPVITRVKALFSHHKALWFNYKIRPIL